MTSVTYLDVLRRTKRNNCGKCGFPSCMAFAAAVAKTGAAPDLCPELDRQDLVLPLAASKDMDSLGSDRDLALIRHLKGKIASRDFATVAEQIGAVCSAARPGILVFSYLGQEVQCSRNQLLINGKEPEDPRDQILLYNYMASGGGRRPGNSWVGIESLPNSISKAKTLKTYCEERLAVLFSENSTLKITDVCRRVGGTIDQHSSASQGMIIPVLPMVPQHLLFWEAEPEDGFSARVKMLFDQNVLDFLDLESLVFSAERLADRMAALFRSEPPRP
jgi:hypothetical protein